MVHVAVHRRFGRIREDDSRRFHGLLLLPACGPLRDLPHPIVLLSKPSRLAPPPPLVRLGCALLRSLCVRG